MKKKICVALGVVMMAACLTACGNEAEKAAADKEQVAAEAVAENTEEPKAEVIEAATETASEYVTYEFETFEGDTVVIDSSNILSQDADEEPLESTKVPAEAEVIAPGRDLVYLADAEYYYVEDAENGLVTVATKGADDTTAAADEVFKNDDFSIAYTPGTFEASEVRGFVRVVYVNEEVQAPGSNEIIITKDEGTTVDDIVKAIVGDGSMDDVSDGSLGADMIPVKSYTRISESPADSALTLTDSFMVMQSGDDVITVEVIRTVGSDEDTDMTVEGAFTHTLESFALN